MRMTSKKRMLTALDGGMPDRLPVTTHFLMPHFLNTCMGGNFFEAEPELVKAFADEAQKCVYPTANDEGVR